jgi:hypothetical protein
MFKTKYPQRPYGASWKQQAKNNNKYYHKQLNPPGYPLSGCPLWTQPQPKWQKKKYSAIVAKFKPQKTNHTPSHICWDVILSNPLVAAQLYSWRWIWVLRQVNKTFNAALQPDQWIRWQCANDRQPMIWKQKANDVLALTHSDLADVKCAVRSGMGTNRFKETHLMWRSEVLGLALAKYGSTFDGVNTIFLKRLSRKKRTRDTHALISN